MKFLLYFFCLVDFCNHIFCIHLEIIVFADSATAGYKLLLQNRQIAEWKTLKMTCFKIDVQKKIDIGKKINGQRCCKLRKLTRIKIQFLSDFPLV